MDDILDTGETIMLASRALQEKGVKEIYVMVTHAVFSTDYWKNLFTLPVKKIICTDTVPHRTSFDRQVEFVSVAPLLLKTLEERYAPK